MRLLATQLVEIGVETDSVDGVNSEAYLPVENSGPGTTNSSSVGDDQRKGRGSIMSQRLPPPV